MTVGFVAAGVYIKMDRRFDAPKPVSAAPLLSIGTDSQSKDLIEKQSLLTSTSESDPPSLKSQIKVSGGDRPLYATPEQDGEGKVGWKRMFAQYGVPLCFPLVFALVASAFI